MEIDEIKKKFFTCNDLREFSLVDLGEMVGSLLGHVELLEEILNQKANRYGAISVKTKNQANNISRLEASRKTLRENNKELKEEIKEYDLSFDLRWKSDMRAIKLWQEETGKKMTWPDHTDLSIWLLRALICEHCGEEKISHCTNSCGT